LAGCSEAGRKPRRDSAWRGQARTHRVVRGGAFNNNTRNVRAAYRINDHPDNRNRNIGFRVVVSTFFSRRHCPLAVTSCLRAEAKNGGACSWPCPAVAGPGE